MSSSYRVQTDPRAKRTYRLAKFRDPVPALSDPSTTVKMTPKTGELGEQEWGLDFGGERPFNGTRERVSGIGGKQSGYVLFRVDPSTGVLTVLPVSEWYDFRHDAMSIAYGRDGRPARPKRWVGRGGPKPGSARGSLWGWWSLLGAILAESLAGLVFDMAL